MAQELNFVANEKSYICSSSKLDRSKVYGFTEKVILDDKSCVCKGGISLGLLDSGMNWVDRSQLVAVNRDGEQVEQIPSTFSTPVVLNNKVTVEHFLDHSITTVYELSGDSAGLADFIGDDIYEFKFNYRAGYDTNPAFLISNAGGLFMLVGYNNNFEYVTLQQTAVIDSEENEEDTEDFDIDFSMM